ncbi:hypothetical protein O181_093923 [Austropuccinia psidii MF-1]|uniref:Uncharacterized protein n=1 Tax=Austropuccinia psidii MF-1 TaxID=1389203 RepID=A0A9Q3P9T2_9BASI|nr:hypothetical protein [Austropuccinia psidii MF-1]
MSPPGLPIAPGFESSNLPVPSHCRACPSGLHRPPCHWTFPVALFLRLPFRILSNPGWPGCHDQTVSLIPAPAKLRSLPHDLSLEAPEEIAVVCLGLNPALGIFWTASLLRLRLGDLVALFRSTSLPG